MKKYLYSFVFATLILMSATVVNASNEVYYTNKQNIEMTEKQYNNLLGLGFAEKQIANMRQDEFNANKDLEGNILSESQKYIKITTVKRNGIKYTTREEITEEEAMQEVELQSHKLPRRGDPAGNYYDAMIETDIQLVTTRIAGIDEDYMRFKTDIEWLTIPSERYYDVIGLGIESAKVYIASSIVFRENWENSNGIEDYDESCSPKYTNTGGLAIYELPNGSLLSLDATLYFNVAKQDEDDTITLLYAGGNNAHATSNVTPSNLISHISSNYGVGVYIDATYSSSYEIYSSAAIAHFSGTW